MHNLKSIRIRPRLKLTKSFYYTFSFLFGIVFLMFVAFAGYTRYSALKALQHELLSYSSIQLKSVADTIDSHMLDMRIVMATLANQESARRFFYSKNPNTIFENNSKILTEQLIAYKNSFSHIDCIYLYSPASDHIVSASNIALSSYAEDTGWMDYIGEAEKERYLLFHRRKFNRYPYLICLLKTINTEYGPAAVSVNVNLSKMNPLPSYSSNSNEQIYIVSDEGQIIYRYSQEQYMEDTSTIPSLTHFDAAKEELQYFIDGSTPYIYSQLHSSEYPWSYILVTDITDYAASISDSQSFIFTLLIFAFLMVILLIFIIVFRAAKPISAIIRLLNNPENFTYQGITDKENREMIQKILTYIQTNSALSEELKKQLSLLHNTKMLALRSQINPHFLMNTLNMIRTKEIDELGYDHNVPNMTLTLSRLLQYALESEDCVSLHTEVYYAKQFVRIMRERYTDTIQFHFQIDTDTEDILVPKLIIQPLVENAVFHGLSALQHKEGILTVSIIEKEEKICLTVRDNGLGMSEAKLAELLEKVSNYAITPDHSIGLHNVILRMHLLYGEAFDFSMESIENEGTAITLRFPPHIS